MTVSTTNNRVSYSGNGVTTAFSFPNKFLSNSDLVVILRVTATGVETVKTITTHYTVTGAGEASGGTVTMVTAPAVGETLTIYRDPSKTQTTDLVENDSLPAETVETTLDKLTMLSQRQQDLVDRSVRLTDGFSSSFNPKLPALLVANKAIIINEDADGLDLGPDADEIENAQGYAEDASDSADAAAASASAASTSASNASSSASAAAASATAASAAVDTIIWRDVSFKVFGDSPISIVDANKGILYAIDCTGGNVVVNLPAISGLTLSDPWSIGLKKIDASTNTVTINRNGTDTIDGSTSLILADQNAGCVLVPDTDPSPDRWTAMLFGASTSDAQSITTKTANYTLTSADDVVFANANAGAFTLTLPLASSNAGKVFMIKKTDDTANAVNLARTSSDLIDGETSQSIIIPKTALSLVSDGVSNWYII